MNLKLEQIARNIMMVEEDIAKLKMKLEGLKRTAFQICDEKNAGYAKSTGEGIVDGAKAIMDSAKTLKASIINK